jgi:hypothetical protein
MKPDDIWQERATAAAIAAARNAIGEKATALVGRLSDREWGWVVAAVIFAWIKTRAEQATAEGLDTELALRVMGQTPEPWDAGAIVTILPELADASNVDWSLPLATWSQESSTTPGPPAILEARSPKRATISLTIRPRSEPCWTSTVPITPRARSASPSTR